MMLCIDQYPDNYNDFPQDFLEGIVNEFNYIQDKIDDAYKNDRGKSVIVTSWNKTLQDRQDFLAEVGICVEYNWPVKKRWALATHADALDEEDRILDRRQSW